MFTRVTKQSSKQVNSFLPTRATPAANAGSAWPTNKEVIWVICHPNKKQSLRASRPPIHGHDVGNVREVRACWLVVLCRCTTANHPHGLHVLWRTKALTLSGSGAAGIGCGADSAWSRTQRRQPSKHETSFLPRAASWRWLRSTGQRIPLTRCPVQMHDSQSPPWASCPVTNQGADTVRLRSRWHWLRGQFGLVKDPEATAFQTWDKFLASGRQLTVTTFDRSENPADSLSCADAQQPIAPIGFMSCNGLRRWRCPIPEPMWRPANMNARAQIYTTCNDTWLGWFIFCKDTFMPPPMELLLVLLLLHLLFGPETRKRLCIQKDWNKP